jgi:lipopolysaccharide export system protein LptC
MNATKPALWLALITLIFSVWFFSNLNNNAQQKNHESSTIDTTITELTVRQYNANGLLANLLTTPLLEHLPQENIHLLTTPHIIIQQDEQPAWEIDSKKAKSFEGGKRITFMEQVVVHQKTGEKTPESTLKTEEVTYYPKEKKATTDLFVTFEQPGNTVQSMGMNAYLDEKRVELLHQARGSYDPAKG